MKIENFNYKKKNGEEGKYNLMVLYENNDHKAGIDLNKLNEDEINEVKAIQQEYEEKMKKIIRKAYRSFIKENIIEEV